MSFDLPTPAMMPPSDDALVGRVIAGKFSLRECIGVGSSGTVYRADQTALGRTVAVKVLRPELACDPRFIRRFQDEAQAASRLNHPNVVSVIDFGQTEDGLLYLVMEFLRGVTLTEILRNEKLSNQRVIHIGQQILSALEEAHENGVVHADLKADNTMVDHRRNGQDWVKVVDFGIARITGGLEETTEEVEDCISGTPEYMAPEIIRGLEPSAATDIYAVGIILYELLVGHTPFSGFSTMDVLKHQVKVKPTPPSQCQPTFQIDKALEAAVLKALSKDPKERFASAQEFSSALQSTTAVVSDLKTALHHCLECNYTHTSTYKFCPECGAAKAEESDEFDLDLADTGHDDFWTDAKPTTDLQPEEMITLSNPVRILSEQDQVKISSATTTPRSISTTKTSLFPLPLLGRNNALGKIHSFIHSKQNRVLIIEGKQGCGASRLLQEVFEHVFEKEENLIFLASADPSGLCSPFYPIRSIVSVVLELPNFCTQEDIKKAIEDIGLNKRDLPGITELFLQEESGLQLLEDKVRIRELSASTIRVLRAAGEQSRAILAFEDYHLYDQASKELLRKIINTSSQSSSTKIIITTKLNRQDNGPNQDGPNQEKLSLGPLSNQDLKLLVTHLATQGYPDTVTLNELREQTHGNPAHIEHLLRYATEGGDLENGLTSLADLIAGRIDFLPQVAKRILQAAAVFGNAVEQEYLSRTLSSSVGKIEMDAALQLLQNRNLLLFDATTLSFSHTFVRDVCYESTPLDVRRTLHLRAGQILSMSSSDPLLLGYHAERAGEMKKASEFLSRAGDNSVRELDTLGAASIYNRALSTTRTLLLSDQDLNVQFHLVEIAIKLANCLRTSGEISLARGILVEAETHSEESPLLRAQLLRAKAQLYATEGKIQAAIDHYKQAISVALPVFALDLLAESYLDLAVMQLRKGESVEAIRELEESIDIISMGEGITVSDAPDRFWRILLRLSQLHSVKGNSKRALPLAKNAARLATKTGSPVGVARSYATLAGILEFQGDSDAAHQYRRKAIDSMRELGDRRTTAELLLTSTRPSQTVHGISHVSIREARLLAEEVGWEEGVRKAKQVAESTT